MQFDIVTIGQFLAECGGSTRTTCHGARHVTANVNDRPDWRRAAKDRIEADEFLEPIQRRRPLACDFAQQLIGEKPAFLLQPHQFPK